MLIECNREDCVLQDLGSMTTLLGWTPIFDKFGNPLNENPNIKTTTYKCLTCGDLIQRKSDGTQQRGL